MRRFTTDCITSRQHNLIESFIIYQCRLYLTILILVQICMKMFQQKRIDNITLIAMYFLMFGETVQEQEKQA